MIMIKFDKPVKPDDIDVTNAGGEPHTAQINFDMALRETKLASDMLIAKMAAEAAEKAALHAKINFEETNAKLRAKDMQSQINPTSAPAHVKSMFDSNDPNMTKVMEYLQKNYSDLCSTSERRLRTMVKQLLPCELGTIMAWGEEALTDYREAFSKAINQIDELSSLNCSETLNEYLDNSKNSKGFFQKLMEKPKESYANRIAMLKMRLNSLTQPILDSVKEIKETSLPLFLASLAAVGDCVKITDDVTEQAMVDRRTTMQAAIQNLQVIGMRLEDTRKEIVKMQSQISHIETVVLPSLQLNRG